MGKNSLRKLSREELLNMLIELTEENKLLKQKLHNAENELNDRVIKIKNAGSIAQAALELNGIFEAAQKAADQYLESIKVTDSQAKEQKQKKS
ncbi:MAG: DNA repair protein [Clostridia bacterium]|nr:DNA repair protein [Clostridia bacterium]